MRRALTLVSLSVVLRLALSWGAAPFLAGDSRTYLHLSLDRPPTVPLLYAALGEDPGRIVLGQTILAGLAWGLLAVAVAAHLRRPRLRVVGVLFVLAFSLTESVLLWDRLILSESVSLSLFALLVASALWWLSPSRVPSGPARVMQTSTRWRW